MSQGLRNDIHRFFAALYVISLTLPTCLHKSASQKGIIAVCLGLFVIFAVPFLAFASAAVISVGGGDVRVNLVESLNLIFATDQTSDSVSIIDTVTETVIKTVTVGSSPITTAYIPSTSLLYVTNQASNDVSVVDVSVPSSASVASTISVGTGPFILSFNSVNDQIYVANCFSNDVSVIDVDSASGTYNTVVKTIPVGVCPTGIAVNDSTNKIYVGNTFSNSVSVIDGNTDTVVSTLNVLGAGAVTVDTINDNVLVSQSFSNAVSVIDGSSDTVMQTITIGNGPRGIEVNPISNQIFVILTGDDAIGIIDASSYNVLGVVPVGFTPSGLAVDSSNVLYVGGPAAVHVINLGSNIPPNANAGTDQVVSEGDTVQLDGSASSDFNGDPLTFHWTQTQGATVVLSSSSDSKPTFDAPDVSGNTLLEFQLIVDDGAFGSIPDFVNVIVKDITTFIVPLNLVGSQLEGDITIDDFPANNQVTFDFINPGGITEGKLEDAKLTSASSGSNVEFDFIASTEEPDTVPPLSDPALYYEIDNTVIDFSNAANFPSNTLPTSQFLIDKNYNAGDTFSDGCPVVYKLLLDETTNSWEIQGDPLTPNTNKIYVVDSTGNQVFAIDGNTNEIIASVDVGDNPRASVFEPTLNKLYVANLNSGTVSVINTLTNTVQSTIPVVGAGSTHIDVAAKKVYVPNFGLGTITVIDANTDTVIDTIVTSGTNLSEIRVNPDLQRLYVVDSASNTLIIVDAVTKTEIDTIALSGIPVGMAINPNNNSVYIALFTVNTVVVVDGVTNAIIKEIPVGLAPVGVGINSLTNKVFVSNAGSGTVSVIDSFVNAEIDTISLSPSILALAVNENTDRVFVANQDLGTVSILDGSKMDLLDTILLSPGIFTVALNDSTPNPVRDPSSDNRDPVTDEILECAYVSKLPHLSKFAVGGVVSLFVGAVGGGGGDSGAPTSSLSSLSSNENFYIPDEIQKIVENHDPYVSLAPMDPDLYEDFDFPLTIEYDPYNGYPLAGYENTIEPNVVQVGTPITLAFTFFEQTEIQHFSLYSGLYGTKTNPSESNIQILYDKDKDLEIYDSFGSITDVKVTKDELESDKIQIVVELTPTREGSIKDLIIRTWDTKRSSLDMIVRNAFEIIPNPDEQTSVEEETPQPEEAPLKPKDMSNPDEQTSVEEETPQPEEAPLKPKDMSNPDEQTSVGKDLPLWIKNNAGWWSQELIDDTDFVAGIEYLMKNKIIIVNNNQESVDSSEEIPLWIKNNAGWWSEGLVTDEEFVNGMEWLVNNGIISG